MEVLAVADKWLTFDCYGTVADWNSCMGAALAAIAGVSGSDASRLLAAGLARAAEREGITLRSGSEEAFVKAWPDMQVFDDAGPALTSLREHGWRLAFLTNCDDDLFATTRARMPAPFDLWVTAEEVRSYKPDLAHFRKL